MRRLVVFLLLCVCVVSCGAVQIIAFCPDPYLTDDMDEYVVLSGHGSLDGIAISDNHGGFRFPAGTFINGTLTVARDAPAFEKTHGSLRILNGRIIPRKCRRWSPALRCASPIPGMS